LRAKRSNPSRGIKKDGLLRRFAPLRKRFAFVAGNDAVRPVFKPTTTKARHMSANEMVLQKLEQGLLTITMNRPDRRNALNPDMTRGLVEAARRAAEDHEVRAVLIKGAGGTFCVGGDVKSMAEGRAPLGFEAKMANLRRGMEVSRILHQMPKPVVAQLDGAAAGAGLSIALSCDLRVASASCKITTAFAKVGLSGDYGGTYFLTQMLGAAKARELYLTSPVLSATEAYNLGMVTKVVPDADIDAEAHDLAMSLAQGPSVTLGYIKRNINNAETMSLEACFDAEAIHHSRAGDTADHKEAARAFVEKRKPVFQGH
jgi:2-(1,2-epoxy-1,2-dihydrophenyl)acetyl-CoA isomerase